MISARLLGILRHVLTFFAGFLVAKGYIDEATSQQLIGLVLQLLVMVASVFAKEKRELSG